MRSSKVLPIAGGVIEGACRHLVQDHGVHRGAVVACGAEAVLRLRALRGDFDDYWFFHRAKEHELTSFPDPIPKPRGHLRIVK